MKGHEFEPGKFEPEILYEDNHCLGVLKPARMPVAGDESGDFNLLDWAKKYLKEKYQKPGNVFVGLVHRLDRPVSGIVLLARTSKGAARLSEQFRTRSVNKKYLALVEGVPQKDRGSCRSWLLKDERQNLVSSVQEGTEGAKEARLTWVVEARGAERAILAVELETGRSHQIRVQLAEMGHPICGDVKYGAKTRMQGAIGLHASELVFEHPTTREEVRLSSPAPGGWERLLFEDRP